MLERAEALWGADAVARALAEPSPSPLRWPLVRELAVVASRGDAPALAAWALALPWPDFASVVLLLCHRHPDLTGALA